MSVQKGPDSIAVKHCSYVSHSLTFQHDVNLAGVTLTLNEVMSTP